MTEQLVRTSISGRSARVELNRPDTGNRFTLAMMKQFLNALEAAIDSAADVVVITASGADFSLGRDQQEPLPEGMTHRDSLSLILNANRLLSQCPGIIVTAVQGRALGFGSGLVVQSDLAVAADTAALGFDEIRHGFAPLIVLNYLEHFVGPKRALDLVLTGREISAGDAEQFGMISRIVPVDQLEATTESLVAGLLARDATALRACKRYSRDIRTVEPAARGKIALDQMAGAP